MNETILGILGFLLVTVTGAFIYGARYGKFQLFKKIVDAQEKDKEEKKKILDLINKKYGKYKNNPDFVIDMSNVVRKRSSKANNGKTSKT